MILPILMLLSLTANAADFTVNFQPDAATLSALVPPGTIAMFGGVASSVPAGWLPADGTSYLKTDYPALSAAILCTYTCPDSTHFKVPNTQGIFVRGAGTQTLTKVYSATLGATVADATAKNGLYDGGHSHGVGSAASNSPIGGSSWSAAYYNSAGPAPFTGTGYSNILSTDSETRPANVAVNYMIKAN